MIKDGSLRYKYLYAQFQNRYLADKVKEFEITNKMLRDEADAKKELLEEVEEKDKVFLHLIVN